MIVVKEQQLSVVVMGIEVYGACFSSLLLVILLCADILFSYLFLDCHDGPNVSVFRRFICSRTRDFLGEL